jgi:hypothetical protein
MNLFSVKGHLEMSTKDEIEDYLEGKKLKNIVLPDNVNEQDQSSGAAKESKIGTKSSLARAMYIQERDKKMQYGDKQAIAEYATEQTEIRKKLEQQKERQLLEYDLLQEEKKRLAIQSKITQEDRDNEKEDIETLERQRDKEINNVYDYFNASPEFWSEWLQNNHLPEESPANILIQHGTVGFVCELHRYKQTIPLPDGRLATSAYTIGPIEDHIRKHEPEMHKARIIESINEKYSNLTRARKEKTLQDKDTVFKRELRDIDSIKTRVGSDPIYAATKLTKGQKARIREAEDAEANRNKRIYGGLY